MIKCFADGWFNLTLSLSYFKYDSSKYQVKKELKFENIPAKRSANVRARCPFCPLNDWLVFLEDGLFLNILSIENDDAESIR